MSIGSFLKCRFQWWNVGEGYNKYFANELRLALDAKSCFVFSETSYDINNLACTCARQKTFSGKRHLRAELALLLQQILNNGLINPHLIYNSALTNAILADVDQLQTNRHVNNILAS